MPGLGLMGNGGSKGPLSTKQKVLLGALVVSGAITAVLLTMLSPGLDSLGPPPAPLSSYAAPDAVAVLHLREAATVRDGLVGTAAWKEAEKGGALRLLDEVAAFGAQFLAPPLRDLEPLLPALLARDAALFVYGAPGGAEIEVLARGKKLDLGALGFTKEEPQSGFSRFALAREGGRSLQAAVQGPWLVVASTKARAEALALRVNPPAGAAPAPRLGDSPEVKALFADAGESSRALLYVDLPRLLAIDPFTRVAGIFRSAASALGEYGPFVLAADTRAGGVSFVATARVRAYPPWLAALRPYFGAPSVLTAPAMLPEKAVAFAASRLDVSKLRTRFLPGAAPLPTDPFSGLQGLLAGALQNEVVRAVDNFTGEVAGGLVRSRLIPTPFAAAAIKDEKLAESTVASLAKFVPGQVNELANLLTFTRVVDVAGAKLHTREVPVLGGIGYGVTKGWLFGGSLSGAEGVAHALAGKGFALHPLSKEAFSSAAHVLGWVDASAAFRVLRNATAWLARTLDAVRLAGRLSEAFLDAGGSARLDDDKLLLRGFLRLRDLPPPEK